MAGKSLREERTIMIDPIPDPEEMLKSMPEMNKLEVKGERLYNIVLGIILVGVLLVLYWAH